MNVKTVLPVKLLLMTLITGIVFLMTDPPGYAQTYREIGLPPSEIFEKMIVYAQEKDFEKLGKTLQLIRPITQT
ncbi:MAG: hypothetical protein ACYDBV_10400 [Nitrospiria bacterium]